MKKTSAEIYEELKKLTEEISALEKEKGVDFVFSIFAARGEEAKDQAYLLDCFRYEENVKGFTVGTLLESEVAEKIYEIILNNQSEVQK